MSYEALRIFADTWGLLFLITLFLLMLVFIFRRGSSAKYKEAARIPLEVSERSEQEKSDTPSDDASRAKGK